MSRTGPESVFRRPRVLPSRTGWLAHARMRSTATLEQSIKHTRYIMALDWTERQRKAVMNILARFPPESGRCEDAARGVLPLARERDAAAHPMRIEPAGRARFVMPNVPLDGSWWRFHVTVQTEHHYVDALTGCDGTPTDAYFAKHWKYPDPDAYHLTPADLTEAPR